MGNQPNNKEGVIYDSVDGVEAIDEDLEPKNPMIQEPEVIEGFEAEDDYNKERKTSNNDKFFNRLKKKKQEDNDVVEDTLSVTVPIHPETNDPNFEDVTDVEKKSRFPKIKGRKSRKSNKTKQDNITPEQQQQDTAIHEDNGLLEDEESGSGEDPKSTGKKRFHFRSSKKKNADEIGQHLTEEFKDQETPSDTPEKKKSFHLPHRKNYVRENTNDSLKKSDTPDSSSDDVKKFNTHKSIFPSRSIGKIDTSSESSPGYPRSKTTDDVKSFKKDTFSFSSTVKKILNKKKTL